jgi:serine/threonine protein kinase
LQGLEYLHKVKKVVHRDIKPSNILLNSKGVVKISDFGVSGELENSQDYKSTYVGTVTYMSPERFKGESYNSDTDLWSLGILLYEMAMG